jgi:hypothetical protein
MTQSYLRGRLALDTCAEQRENLTLVRGRKRVCVYVRVEGGGPKEVSLIWISVLAETFAVNW